MPARHASKSDDGKWENRKEEKLKGRKKDRVGKKKKIYQKRKAWLTIASAGLAAQADSTLHDDDDDDAPAERAKDELTELNARRKALPLLQTLLESKAVKTVKKTLPPHKLLDQEMNRYEAVLAHPRYQADPLDTLKTHLTNEMAREKEARASSDSTPPSKPVKAAKAKFSGKSKKAAKLPKQSPGKAPARRINKSSIRQPQRKS